MPHQRNRPERVVMMMGVGAVFGLAAYMVSTAAAYPRYRLNGNGGYCVSCHGDFDGPMSPTGAVFPGDSKHTMHRSSQWMNTDCLLCHVQTGDIPLLNFSAGTSDTPGLGCIGCHGQDLGPAIGVSGAGLRAHHAQAGVAICASCHPSDPTPLPERFPPPYYGSVDTNVDDPCNTAPGLLENWTVGGDTTGLDNDGDGIYDMLDRDCSCPADSNDDGIVNIVDLLGLLAAWGGMNPLFDIAPFPGDGTVNIQDLLDLLAGWGNCT